MKLETLYAAAVGFPSFRESQGWRRRSARLPERQLLRNTFAWGIDRELPSDYHCFVAVFGLLAAVEGRC